MTRDKIESRMTPHVLNVSLAAVGRREDFIRLAKDRLFEEVEKIARESEHSGCFCPHCNPH